MGREDLRELNIFFRAFLLFIAHCIPFLISAIPIFMAIILGGLWYLFLLPVSAILGIISMNAVKIATEGLKEKD